ncbi:hypothetical protein [Chelativorans sp.]|uniref:hypothetical protein n=1 Tax=Chelativorans sp. TaxID=2203393 RepID=UPI0028122542|nr:hypothetical protein [Chelativorans sp.]
MPFLRNSKAGLAAGTLLAAGVLAAPPAAAADSAGAGRPMPAETYPYVDGVLELTLGDDYVFRSDDPANEINDLFFEAWLGLTVGLTPIFSINAGLTLEAVEDPGPFEDRHFGDMGLYVDTLNLQADLGKFSVVAGKFGPGFGTAWDITPGVYGTDFAEDYELSEQFGLGLAYTFETAGHGTHTLGANVFFADTTALSESVFTRRGRLDVIDGGAGNTEELDNFSVTLDGKDFPGLSGFSYHLGYRHLSAGLGDPEDENGFAAGLAQSLDLGNGASLALNGEVAYFSNYGGSLDDALYVTSGLALASGPWHGEIAGTIRKFDFDGGDDQTDYLAQVSGGYTFDNGVDVSLGYGFAREAEIDTHALGVRLTKSFEFSTRTAAAE